MPDWATPRGYARDRNSRSLPTGKAEADRKPAIRFTLLSFRWPSLGSNACLAAIATEESEDDLARAPTGAVRTKAAARRCKQELTLGDVIAAIHRVLWALPNLSMPRQPGGALKISVTLLNRLFQARSMVA